MTMTVTGSCDIKLSGNVIPATLSGQAFTEHHVGKDIECFIYGAKGGQLSAQVRIIGGAARLADAAF